MRRIEKKVGYGGLFAFATGIPVVLAIRGIFHIDFEYRGYDLYSALQITSTAAASGAGLMAAAVSAFARVRERNYFPSIAATLLFMGILAGAMSVHPVDGRYLVLVALTNLVGALFVGSAWFADRMPRVLAHWRLSFLAVAASFAVIFVADHWSSAEFLLPNGRYGRMFLLLMNLSGVVFLGSSAYFVRAYQRWNRLSDLVFAYFALLSGMSNLCWPGLFIWGPVWWICQIAQTTAFLLVMAYLIRLHLFLERSLEESQHRVETLANATFEGVLVLRDGRAVDWNAAFTEISGLGRNEIRGLPLSALLPADAVEAMQTGETSRQTFLRGQSRHVPVEVRSRRSNGTCFVIFRDLSERRLLEREVAETQGRLNDVFRYSTDGIAYAELDGTVLQANDAFSRLTGYSKDALAAGVAATDVLLGGGDRPTPAALGRSCEYERDYLNREGKRISVMQTEFPVRNVDGRVTHVGILVKDITESRQATETLRSLNEELTRSNRELDRFAAIVSHDLAEPLRTIATALRLLEKKEGESLGPDSRGYLRFSLAAADRLRALIRGLLSYSRVHATSRDLRAVDCGRALDNVLENIRTLLDESGATVHASQLPEVQAEPELVELLLQNLLVNAVKYRRECAPEVHVDAQPCPEGWHFAVRDNGTGIGVEARERIFGLFTRGRTEVPGQGIGLATCKKIVESFGGRIWCDSTVEVGSVFHFVLPAAHRTALAETTSGKGSPRPDNLVS